MVNVALVPTKSNIGGNSMPMVNVALVPTKSNVSGNSKVDVVVLLVLTKSNTSGNINVAVAILLVTSVAAATILLIIKLTTIGSNLFINFSSQLSQADSPEIYK